MIEGNVLKRPAILDPNASPSGPPSQQTKSLDDIGVLRQIVHQPMNFTKWAIFCLERDVENAKFFQERIYVISEKMRLNIYIDYGDVVALRNSASIEDFKEAVQSYYNMYVVTS